MRYSTLEGSAFYRAEMIGRVKVFCDGEEVADVREASDTGGWVIFHARAAGPAFPAEGVPLLGSRFGKVRIEIMEDLPGSHRRPPSRARRPAP